jgi:hypothetical protein
MNDAEIQCSIDKHDQITQTTNQEKLIDENILKTETEKFVSENNILQDEINNLNFQLSTFIIQRTTTENVRILPNIIWYFNKIYFYSRKLKITNVK